MRIGFGCSMIEPAITQGQIDGVGFYTKHLLNEFNLLGKTVLPYSFPPLKNRHIASSIPQGKMLKLPYMLYTASSLCLPKALPLYPYLEKEIDLYHAPDHLVPKLKKTPVVATLHDGLILTHPQWYNSRFRYLKNAVRVKSLRWADHVITISQSMLQETVEFWGIKPEKISVIHNGITEEWFEEIPLETRKNTLNRLGIPENFLLVVGTLQPKKNIPRIIQAYLSLPEGLKKSYPLVIVGKAGWNTEESLAAIQKLTTSQSGYWLKYISDEDIKVLFQATRLYLHPSLHEGFGLTILQAFASKVPVVTSNITAMPETAGNAAYLVDPYQAEDIAHAIEKMLHDSRHCQELVELGYARAKLFSWKKCAEETFAVYEHIR